MINNLQGRGRDSRKMMWGANSQSCLQEVTVANLKIHQTVIGAQNLVRTVFDARQLWSFSTQSAHSRLLGQTTLCPLILTEQALSRRRTTVEFGESPVRIGLATATA